MARFIQSCLSFCVKIQKVFFFFRGVSLEHILPPPSEEEKKEEKKLKKKRETSFKYLGRLFTTQPELSTEISARLQKANKSFYNLVAPLYRRKDISLRNKVSIFKSTVLSLLWGSETWAPSSVTSRV